MPTKTTTEKPLSAKQLKAAALVGEDALSNARIAAECGISTSTLDKWKQDRQFQDAVRKKVQELDDAVSQLQYAKRRERIRALDDMARDYVTIAEERAAWFAINDPDVPGGRTGRIVRQERVLGSGKGQVRTTEYVLDKALDQGLRDTFVHIAKERGEWSDGRRELSGPNGTPLLPIIEIEVHKQTSPPDIDGDDDD
jgi:hypothetical protein